MPACGREFHIAYMRSKRSSLEAAGRGLRARNQPTKYHTCSIGDISGTLACNPRCRRRRRIDEVDISKPVAVDQRAANCLEEAVRSFTGTGRPLPIFRVVRCSAVHYFQTRITVELFHCTRAPVAR
ncbi:uncharacterized protein TNCV_371091 [Trichonephila clavipes]|nr:uncharacterized protein TNCV_371091 [Trichonephila clavipes]